MFCKSQEWDTESIPSNNGNKKQQKTQQLKNHHNYTQKINANNLTTQSLYSIQEFLQSVLAGDVEGGATKCHLPPDPSKIQVQ